MRFRSTKALIFLGIAGLSIGCSGRSQDPQASAAGGASATTQAAVITEGRAEDAGGFVAPGSEVAPPVVGSSLSPSAVAGRASLQPSSQPGAFESESESGSEPDPSEPELERNAFVGFGSDTTVADVASDPAAKLMYVVEADGTLRVLDTSSVRPRLVRALSLFPQALSQGQGLGRLELVGPSVALLPTWGSGFEGLAVFDPLRARGSKDVAWFDLGGLRATWPAGTLNSQGVEVGGRSLPLTQVTGATLIKDVVYLCAANVDAEGDHSPGVVAALRLDRVQRRLEPLTLIRTSAFNPTGLRRLGGVLLVTNSGSLGQSGASVDVIDLQTASRYATIRFPQRLADGRIPDPFGPVIVSPDGRQGYVGSLSQARLYSLDLESMTYVQDLPLPSESTRNSTRRLAISGDGERLYASNAGDRALNVVSVGQDNEVTRVSGFSGSDSSPGQGQLEGFVVQSAGVDQPEALLAVVNDLPAEDRVRPDVSSTMDRVQLD